MLYYLSHLSSYFGPFRLFDYLSFRAGGAAMTGFLIVLLLGGPFARYLKKLNAQAADRYAGILPPEFIDQNKLKTPCMGGVLIVGAILIASFLWNLPDQKLSYLLCLNILGFAAIGFVDDFYKVFRKQRDGLTKTTKLIFQFLIAIAGVSALYLLPETAPFMGKFMIPFMKTPLFEHKFAAVISVIAIVGAANAANFTDGKDGLAAGCSIYCSLVYAAFAYLMGHKIFASYLSIPFAAGIGEAVVFASALCGSCIGFLWHNCHPAAMFMGDTGSLALGGAIGFLAVLVRQEVLLILVGFVMVMEILSVIIQIASFRLTGKRVFLCTPIHHHFERLGWTETQIVVRFWIIGGVCALLALATLKLR